MTTVETLRVRLEEHLDERSRASLRRACARVAGDPGALATTFPAVARQVGRGPLDDEPLGWRVEDVARVLLLDAAGVGAGAAIEDLYRYGDADERRAIVRALPYLGLGDAAMALVSDALRSNDARLIAAALSPYALERLDPAAVRQAVLKCVFTEIPLSAVRDLDAHASPELSRSLAEYALERVTAGRSVPGDIWPLVDRYPPDDVLDALEHETRSPHEDRRTAARRALADRRELRT